MITIWHHSASLVMPIGDPWDGFFYPTLTRMMDSYNFIKGQKYNVILRFLPMETDLDRKFENLFSN